MTVAFCNLGCKVNLYETEYLINQFINQGYERVDFNQRADIYVINTCAVTNQSEAKGRQMLNRARKLNCKAVIVVLGCYAQLKSNDLCAADIIVGTQKKEQVLSLVELFLKTREKINVVEPLVKVKYSEMMVPKFWTRTRAFVKVQDGCQQFCTYCIIPYVRGGICSRCPASILKEIKALIANGHLEIVLTGINLGCYKFKEIGLVDLIKDIIRETPPVRIRLSSLSINVITTEFLELLQMETIIANHLHISLQAGSDQVLTAMKRGYTTSEYAEKIKAIRKVRPKIALTTDVIVGFPGETATDFLATIDFVKKIGFSDIHIFPYAKKEGTKAALLPNQICTLEKRNRVKALTVVKKELGLKYLEQFKGEMVTVIIEQKFNNYGVGYSDNYILVKIYDSKLEIGQLKIVKISKIEYPYAVSL